MTFDDYAEAKNAEAIWGGFARQQAAFRQEIHQRVKIMHYKNGREAKNGDKVILIPSYGPPMVGILYDAVAGNDTCNGRIAPTSANDPMPNLQECLHFDDVKAVATKELPITNKM